MGIHVAASTCRSSERRRFGGDRGHLHLAIDEQRRTLIAAVEATAFVASIVESIPHMVFVKDATELRFERFNKAGEALLGVSRDQLIGKNDHDFFPPEQAEAFIAADRETLRGGAPVDIAEEPIQTPTGTRWLHTKKVPIHDWLGQPKYLLGISEDITERARRKPPCARPRSRRVLEPRAGDVRYSVAHDLRAPLRAIDGFGHALVEDPALRWTPPRAGSSIASAQRQRMGRLIDDLLRCPFSRAEPICVPVDLTASSPSGGAGGQAEPGRRVQVVIAPGVGCVGDPGLLRVALDTWWATPSSSRAARGRVQFGPRRRRSVRTSCAMTAWFDIEHAASSSALRATARRDFEGRGSAGHRAPRGGAARGGGRRARPAGSHLLLHVRCRRVTLGARTLLLLVETTRRRAPRPALAAQGASIRMSVARDGVEASVAGRLRRAGRQRVRCRFGAARPQAPAHRRPGVLRRLRAERARATLPVVLLTSSRQPEDVARAYELGANGTCASRESEAFFEAVRTIGAYWLKLNEPPRPRPDRVPASFRRAADRGARRSPMKRFSASRCRPCWLSPSVAATTIPQAAVAAARRAPAAAASGGRAGGAGGRGCGRQRGCRWRGRGQWRGEPGLRRAAPGPIVRAGHRVLGGSEDFASTARATSRQAGNTMGSSMRGCVTDLAPLAVTYGVRFHPDGRSSPRAAAGKLVPSPPRARSTTTRRA